MQWIWMATLGVVGVACWTDWRERRIPNWLTSSGIGLGVVIHFTQGGMAGVMQSLLGILLGLGLLLILFMRGGIGGGDVKLLMALGALTGPAFLVGAFLLGSICGALYSLAVIVRKSLARRSWAGASIPYALPIAAGVVLEMARQSGWLW